MGKKYHSLSITNSIFSLGIDWRSCGCCTTIWCSEKIVVFSTLVLGIFTQVFAGFGALIAMIPIIGPILIKVVTIPFFWMINALGHGVSIVAIKKGYTNELVKSRVLTIALLIGIVLGYIMGNLIPLQ